MSDAPNATATSRTTWVRAFKLIVVVLVAVCIVRMVYNGWDQLRSYSWQLNASWLAVSAILYLLGLLPSAFFWRQTLFALGQQPTWRDTLRAYFLGHLGKYVPGKAMVVVIRAGALGRGNVNVARAAISVFLETLTMMAVGAAVSAVIVIAHFGWQHQLAWLAVGVLAVAGLPTLPPVFRYLVRRLPSKWRGADQRGDVDLSGITYRLMLTGWLSITVGWFLMGLSLWATLQALGTPDLRWPGDWPLTTAAVALAVVVGFASLIPGGAGVRDWVLAVLMIPRFGTATALISAFLLRMVWLVSELAISGILYKMGPDDPATELNASQQKPTSLSP